MRADGNSQQPAEDIERLVNRVSEIADPAARETAFDLVQAVMQMHGRALEKLMEVLAASDAALLDRMVREPAISALLLLYGLHPEPLEQRLARALEEVRHRIQRQHCDAELVGIADGAIRIRFKHGNGCRNTALKEMVEAAIWDAAPDASDVIIEETPMPAAAFQLVQLR